MAYTSGATTAPWPVIGQPTSSEPAIEQALNSVTEFFEDLLNIHYHGGWTVAGWLRSKQAIYQAERIIYALL